MPNEDQMISLVSIVIARNIEHPFAAGAIDALSKIAALERRV